ncbi:hypothetical protein CBM2629_A60153 [Cupriavidus taiwanensis]|nr:hypothetical protein CBM2629_A60153 [Cupriavidus taiwanensis]
MHAAAGRLRPSHGNPAAWDCRAARRAEARHQRHRTAPPSAAEQSAPIPAAHTGLASVRYWSRAGSPWRTGAEKGLEDRLPMFPPGGHTPSSKPIPTDARSDYINAVHMLLGSSIAPRERTVPPTAILEPRLPGLSRRRMTALREVRRPL